MKLGSRYARLSAAVMAALCATSPLYADNLIWNPGQSTTGGTDGGGNWDNTSTNWYDSTTSTGPVAFKSTTPDSATFGTSANTTAGAFSPYYILVNSNITVQNITLGATADGHAYTITDNADNTAGNLTLAGNVTKSAAYGINQFQLSNPLTLTTGSHVFAINDSPGDTAEIEMDSPITGLGSITIDNASAGYQQYGTVLLATANTYQGGTNINSGRVALYNSNSLGSGVTTIGTAGELSIGGASTAAYIAAHPLNLTGAINITRSDYTSAGHTNYVDALSTENGSGTTTISGPFTVDSTDARVGAHSSTIVINSNIQQGPDVTAGVLTLDGDYAGFVTLTGNNTALLGGIKIMGGVEVNVDKLTEIGGGTAPSLNLAGGTFHPVGGFITDFSQLTINNGTSATSLGTLNGGVDVDAGKAFNASGLYGVALGSRGTGTLNFNGSNVFSGVPFFDAGAVNVNGSTSMGAFRLRSSTLNINNGGTLTTTNSFTDIGSDSPDKGTVNVNNGGTLTLANQDFNVSDNAGTQGTLNIATGGTVSAAGNVYVGKSLNATGTVNMTGGAFSSPGLVYVGQNNGTGVYNQSGGTINLTRNANFTFVLGDGRGGTHANGTFNLSGGTFTSAGEVYAGEGNNTSTPGFGQWLQTGGNATINNWLVVGREGAYGKFDISGGTLTHNGGNMSMGDSGTAGGAAANPDIINIHGTAIVNDVAGEFWVGNGGANATMTMADTASLTVNNWLAVGRGGGSVGVVNQSGGTVTKTVGSNGFFAVGSGGNGSYNQTGGKLNIDGTRDGESSSGTLSISGGTDVFTGEFSLGYAAGVVGTLNVSGTANVTLPAVVIGVNSSTATTGGVLNLNGGTLTAASFVGGSNATSLRTFDFNGGTLKPSAANTNFIGAKITGVVSTGGAIINPNSFAITVGSALTHDTTVSGADGGLKVSGPGALTLTGADTYTGATVLTAAATQLNVNYSTSGTTSSSPLLTGPGGTDLQGSGKVVFNYTGSTTPVQTIRSLVDASNNGGTNRFQTGKFRATVGLDSHHGIGYLDDGTSTVSVQQAYLGDANLDGVVNVGDLGILASNYGNTSGTALWQQADFTYDGSVDVGDLGVLASEYGDGTGMSAAASAAMFQSDLALVESHNAAFAAALGGYVPAVPEPTSITVLAIASAGLLARRRRRTV